MFRSKSFSAAIKKNSRTLAQFAGRYALFFGMTGLLWLIYQSTKIDSYSVHHHSKSTSATAVLVFSMITTVSAVQSAKRRQRALRFFAKSLGFALLTVSAFIAAEKLVAVHGKWKIAQAIKAEKKSGPIGIKLDKKNAAGKFQYAAIPAAFSLPSANRVVSVHNSQATNWDHSTGYHWQYINQAAVSAMMVQGLKTLTGQSTAEAAWRTVVPYQAGQAIAIKINNNNSTACNGYPHVMDAYPETMIAIIEGLVSIGVPQERIWITDPSRMMQDRFRNAIKARYPNVLYYIDTTGGTCGDSNVRQLGYVSPSSPDANTAQCPAGEKILINQVFVNASHIINVPSLKNHGGNYVTLALKNHYGSVLYEHYNRESMHVFFDQGNFSGGCGSNADSKNILADINNNAHLYNKTRLTIGEGLFGNQYINYGNAERWRIFGNDDPNILFFGAGPVEISSVMADYLIEERGALGHHQLHAGASIGLGVHEHWDNFANKHYSAIDYIALDMDGGSTKPLMPLNFRMTQ